MQWLEFWFLLPIKWKTFFFFTLWVTEVELPILNHGKKKKSPSITICDLQNILGSPPCQQTIRKACLASNPKHKHLEFIGILTVAKLVSWKKKRAFWRQTRWVFQKKKDVYTEKNLISAAKHGGGSMMLCGCFSSKEKELCQDSRHGIKDYQLDF